MTKKNGLVEIRALKETNEIEIRITDPDGVYGYRVWQQNQLGPQEAHRNAPPDPDDCPNPVVIRNLAGKHHHAHIHEVKYWDCQPGNKAWEEWRLAQPPRTSEWQKGIYLDSGYITPTDDDDDEDDRTASIGGRLLRLTLAVLVLVVVFRALRRRSGE